MVHARSTAFTLIELLISLGILGSVMVIVTMSLDTSSRFTDRFSRQTEINNKANSVLNKLAMQLRMAAAHGDDISAATALEIPGGYPVGFIPKNPSNAANVTAYKYAVSTGLGDKSQNFLSTFEPYKRAIIYDYSVLPGRLVLQTRDPNTGATIDDILTEEVAENGFSLNRIGNTLQMALTLRSQTRVEEEIIYTALAQTLFLRSTLNTSSGKAAMNNYTTNTDTEGNNINDTSGAPNVMFGNLVTVLSTSELQMSAFISAPIGKKIDPKSIVVLCGEQNNPAAATVVDEGVTVKVISDVTGTRATFPPADQWPSRNGTYSVTLTFNKKAPVGVIVRASTTDGDTVESFKNYN